jgi:hypothetical protein
LNIPVVAVLGFSIAIYLYTHDVSHITGWLDWTALGLFVLLLGWLLSPARLVNADSHESAGNGIAFRCGKALKRVLNHRSRDPTTSDQINEFLD